MLISERGIYNKNGYIVRNKIEILQKIFVPWDEKRYFKKKMFAPWDMGYGIVPRDMGLSHPTRSRVI